MIKILVPLDGSSTAEAALPHASAMAHTFSAEVELISVVGEPGSDYVTRLDSVDWHLRKRQRQVYLDSTADTLRKKGHCVATILCEGDAATEIVRRINETNTDLLVLTRFGMGNAQSFSGGGTARKIISASVASVLLINPQVEYDDTYGYANILVAVDGSQRSEWASSFAAMVAQTFDGSVKLLQVIDAHYFPSIDAISPDTRRVLDHIERAARSQANFQLSHLTAKIGDNADVSGAIVVADDVAAAIESYASEGKSDLLVIAAQGEYANTAGRYGHICESLLSHMRRPIRVLRSEPPDLTMSNFRSVFLNESHADIV